MQRERKSYDQELSANIARACSEVHRDKSAHPNPFTREMFHIWNIPEFVHEAIHKPPQPSISLAELKATYDNWIAQNER